MEHDIDDYDLMDQDFELFVKKGLEAFGLIDGEGKTNEDIDR